MNLELVGAYVGPDQMMPLVSILATILGFLLLFWNKCLGLLRRIGGLFKRPAGDSSVARPTQKQPPPQG